MGGSAALGSNFNSKGTVIDNKLGKNSFLQGLHHGNVEQKNLRMVGLGLTKIRIDFRLSLSMQYYY